MNKATSRDAPPSPSTDTATGRRSSWWADNSATGHLPARPPRNWLSNSPYSTTTAGEGATAATPRRTPSNARSRIWRSYCRSWGTASVYAHSPSRPRPVRAAAAGLPILRLVLHEPPYTPDGAEEERRIAREIGERHRALLAENRRRRGRAGHDDDGDAAGDGRSDAPDPQMGGAGGDGAHDRIRLGDHGLHRHRRHRASQPPAAA